MRSIHRVKCAFMQAETGKHVKLMFVKMHQIHHAGETTWLSAFGTHMTRNVLYKQRDNDNTFRSTSGYYNHAE